MLIGKPYGSGLGSCTAARLISDRNILVDVDWNIPIPLLIDDCHSMALGFIDGLIYDWHTSSVGQTEPSRLLIDDIRLAIENL